MGSDSVSVRPAEDEDRRSLALLLASVAGERDGIAAEPPVDVEQLAAHWEIDGTLVAMAAGDLVGEIRIDPSWMGFGEIGMFGFVEEGRLRRHVRRSNGQLWDLIEMGLLLKEGK